MGYVTGLTLALPASILLARALGPSDRGLLAVMLLVGGTAVALTGSGFPWAVGYYASRRDTPPGTILGHTLIYLSLLTAASLLVFTMFKGVLADVFAKGRGGDGWILVGVFVPVTLISYVVNHYIVAKLRFALGNVVMVLSEAVHLAVVAILLVVLGMGAAGGIVAAIAAAAFICICGLALMIREGRPTIDPARLRSMIGYGLRAQFGSISQVVSYRLDVLVLQFFRPLAEVGYYVVAQTIAELVLILAIGFQGSVLPLVARAEPEDQTVTTASALRHHSVLAAAAVPAVALFGWLVIAYAFGPDFEPAVALMLILLPGMWCLGTGMVVWGDLLGRERPGLASALHGVGFLVMVVLCVVLIPPLGATGAALASLLAYGSYGGASLIAASRVSGLPLPALVVPRKDDLILYRLAATSMLRALARAARSRRATLASPSS